jgi:hypothetical protein
MATHIAFMNRILGSTNDTYCLAVKKGENTQTAFAKVYYPPPFVITVSDPDNRGTYNVTGLSLNGDSNGACGSVQLVVDGRYSTYWNPYENNNAPINNFYRMLFTFSKPINLSQIIVTTTSDRIWQNTYVYTDASQGTLVTSQTGLVFGNYVAYTTPGGSQQYYNNVINLTYTGSQIMVVLNKTTANQVYIFNVSFTYTF